MTLAAYRAVCAAAAVVVPLSGVLAHAMTPGVTDPMAVRFGLAAVMALGIALSYVPRYQRAFVRIVQALCYSMVAWPAWLGAMNPGQPWYFAAACCLYAMLALVFSLSVSRVISVSVYLAYGFAAITLALTLSAPPHLDVPSLLVALAASTAGLYLASAARIRTTAALARREASALQAQRIARMGTWEWDGVGGAVTFSDELYRMLGHTPDTLRPTFESLFTFVHPEDLPIPKAIMATALKGQTPQPHEIRLLRLGPPGEPPPEPLWARAMFHVEADEEGRIVWAQGTVLDISEQKAHQQMLEAATAAAEEARVRSEEAVRLQQAFLANMSHEIRTPLTAILGFSRLLREDASADQLQLLAPVEQSGERLQRTLEAVLDLAQVEAGTTALDLQTFDLRAVVRAAAQRVRPAAEEKGIAFNLRLDARPVPCYGDPEAAQRICHHLLDNAVKFTERGAVSTHVRTEGGRAAVCVEDTGIGLDPAQLPYLFQPFRQASTGLTRSHEGSGLGLTLAYRLAELMNGRLSVESKQGQGCRFSLTLPPAPPAAAITAPDSTATAPEDSAGRLAQPVT